MRRLARFVPCAVTLLALVNFGTGSAEAGTIAFAGSSSGCFTCGAGGASSASAGGLSFDGSTFAGISVGAGGSAVIDLGTLTLGSSAYNYGRHHPSLLLGVTFGDPGDLSSSYDGKIEGSVNLLGNGAVNVQLDKTVRTYAFSNESGYGSFDFGLLDSTLHLKPGDSLTLWGMIQNLQYTLNPLADTGTGSASGGTGGDQPPPGGDLPSDPSRPVPEPMTLLLFGCGVAAALRRRPRGC